MRKIFENCNRKVLQRMALPESPKPVTLPGVKSLIVFWVIFGLLGLCGLFTITIITGLDSSVQWEKLIPAPPNIDKLLGDKSGIILVRTTTGQILSCAPNKRDECWIPNILLSDPIKQCDLSSNYFNPLTHPPRNIVDCVDVQVTTQYLHTSVYARDQQGYIWRWLSRDPGDRFDTLIFAPCLGLFGILIGSGVWTIWWYLRKRSLSKKQLPAPDRSRSFVLWTLVTLPMLCIISVSLVSGIYYFNGTRFFSQENPIFASVDTTANAKMTAIAEPFLISITPNAAGPAYDFASECDSGKWYAELNFEITCSTHYFGMGPFIETLELQAKDWQAGFSGKALLFSLPAGHTHLWGDFPAWNIQPGDHFHATLGCKGEISECDMQFDLALMQRDESRILQGFWVVTSESLTTDIDVDLSRFAGKQVLLELSVYKLNDSGTFQSILLVNPRIINLP